MILFLTLLYVGVLLLAIKFKLIEPTLWWKLSPLFWSIFLLVALFIPLQFWAPSGPLIVGNYTVSVIPRVAGEVTEIVAKQHVLMNKGDVLFKIDLASFQVVFNEAKASLELARIRLKQEEDMEKKGVGRKLDLDRARAQLAQAQAKYDRTKYDLDATTVRAPAAGYVTNLNLRPGARVVSFPVQSAMAFIESGRLIVGALVMQNHLRFIEHGQRAEIAFKMHPGRVFEATVEHIIPARATGFESPTGLPVIPQELPHLPLVVRIELGEEAAALNLPSGATGRVAIYSSSGSFTHIIRMVEIRIEAIMNYINPF